MHGANRLGGNSLSDLLVFGARAGAAAAKYAKDAPRRGEVSDSVIAEAERDMLAPFQNTGDNPFAVQEQLQNMMMTEVGVYRSEQKLAEALAAIRGMRERAGNARATGTLQYNPGWHAAIDLKNMTLVAETIATHALMRKESRGAHTRVDFPKTSEELEKVNVVSRLVGGKIEATFVNREAMPDELAELAKGETVVHTTVQQA
ncbi:MAG: hypothetical protein ACREMT_06400 [Vulcanimicrobiaceae bacterium]